MDSIYYLLFWVCITEKKLFKNHLLFLNSIIRFSFTAFRNLQLRISIIIRIASKITYIQDDRYFPNLDQGHIERSTMAYRIFTVFCSYLIFVSILKFTTRFHKNTSRCEFYPFILLLFKNTSRLSSTLLVFFLILSLSSVFIASKKEHNCYKVNIFIALLRQRRPLHPYNF